MQKISLAEREKVRERVKFPKVELFDKYKCSPFSCETHQSALQRLF